jgi:hypothetical protein
VKQNTGKYTCNLLGEEPGLAADRYTHAVNNRLLERVDNIIIPGRMV